MVSFSLSLFIFMLCFWWCAVRSRHVFSKEKKFHHRCNVIFSSLIQTALVTLHIEKLHRDVSLIATHTHPCRYTNCAIKQSLWRWQISDRVATYCDDRNLILIVHIVPLKKFAVRKFVQHTTKQIGGICVYLCLVRILYHTHTHKTKKIPYYIAGLLITMPLSNDNSRLPWNIHYLGILIKHTDTFHYCLLLPLLLLHIFVLFTYRLLIHHIFRSFFFSVGCWVFHCIWTFVRITDIALGIRHNS